MLLSVRATQPLTAGAPIHVSLAAREEVVVTLEVPTGNAAHIVVKQEGIDVGLLLVRAGTEPNERTLDLTSGIAGEETLFPPISDSATTWDLIVKPALPHAKRGDVTISLELAPADAHARAVAAAREQFRVMHNVPGGSAENYRTTLAGYAAAAEAALAAGDKALAAEALYSSARSRDLLGDTPGAIETQLKALALFRELGRRDREARVLDRLGDLSRKIAEITEAQQYFDDALVIAREINDPVNIADILNNSALISLWVGQWEETIERLTAALPIAREIESSDIEGAMTHNMGEAWDRLGLYDKSIEAFQRSLELKRALNLPRRIARTQRSMAVVYFEKGERAKAMETMRSAIALTESSGDRTSYAEALGSYGSMFYTSGDRKRAAELFARALPILREVKSRGGEIDVLNDWAQLELAEGHADAALQKAGESMAIARATTSHQDEAKSLYISALAFRKKGDLHAAIGAIGSAIDIIESLRSAIVRSELRTSYLSTVRSYFELYIDLVQQSGASARAFEISERAHARTLVEGIAESAAKIGKGIDPALLKRQRAVQAELSAKERYRAQLLQSDGEAGPRVAAIESKIAHLLDEWHNVEADIRTSSPAWSALRAPQPVSARYVQSNLIDANTSLIEYHLGATRSYAWVVDSKHVTAHVLPARGEIERLARRYHQLLSRDAEESDAEEIAAAGRRLAAAVWQPIAKRVTRARLLIVPDGALDYVPFSAMPAANGAPLIVDHEIVILPSASVLDTIRKTAHRELGAPSAAVFADPVFSVHDVRVSGDRDRSEMSASIKRSDAFVRLRFSRAEANAIVAAAKADHSFEALDFNAAKHTLLGRDLRRFNILHFATHGVLNTQHPELSGLVLSLVDENGKAIDGFLHLHEIYNLDLDAALVVLSACRTALGKEVFGEGLIGLTRGFMYAGASRVVSSVWNVDDRASAQLMSRFYDAMLSKKRTPAAALRDAQLALLRQPRWANPHYWAAFALQGEWR